MQFPNSIQLGFNFKTAYSSHAIKQLLYSRDCEVDFLKVELKKLRIEVSDG